jgi:hypothetical protein
MIIPELETVKLPGERKMPCHSELYKFLLQKLLVRLSVKKEKKKKRVHETPNHLFSVCKLKTRTEEKY